MLSSPFCPSMIFSSSPSVQLSFLQAEISPVFFFHFSSFHAFCVSLPGFTGSFFTPLFIYCFLRPFHSLSAHIYYSLSFLQRPSSLIFFFSCINIFSSSLLCLFAYPHISFSAPSLYRPTIHTPFLQPFKGLHCNFFWPFCPLFLQYRDRAFH